MLQCETTLLVHFNLDLKLVLSCDASNYGIGVVLLHEMVDGTEHPTGYAFCSLNSAERNYLTIEKEAFLIIVGVKKFHQFLYGKRSIIQTDHKPLQGLLGRKKEISPRVQ